MPSRSLVTVLIAAAIILLPYYIYVPALFISLAVFPYYYEGILLGLLIDMFFGRPFSGVAFGLPFGIGAAACIIVAALLRDKLRSHA